MIEPPIEPAILTFLEAARRDPPLHRLRYSEAFIEKLLFEYEIRLDLKADLWDTLEGAAHNICTLPPSAFAEVDAKKARKKVREVAALARRLIGTLSELTINPEPHGDSESGSFVETETQNTVRRAVWALTHAQMTHGHSQLPFRRDAFPFSTKELRSGLTQLSEIASALSESPYARGSGPNKLMPLKVYTLTILHFWRFRADKGYSRSHETHRDSSIRNSRNETTINSKRTDFVPFLKACLNEIGERPADRSLQTAIESAVGQLEGRSDEIPLATADWNFV
ncbi:MAG: hypothetical protein ACOZAA_16085 [Pseudomonadota bacterium]